LSSTASVIASVPWDLPSFYGLANMVFISNISAVTIHAIDTSLEFSAVERPSVEVDPGICDFTLSAAKAIFTSCADDAPC
jgi:hypothetical protein